MSETGNDTGLPARRAALDALRAVMMEHRLLSHLPTPAELSGEEAARAHRLALTVLRHLGRLDAVLRPYLQRRPTLAVQNLLRLGAAELLVDGSEPHGVVASLVEIAKRHPRWSRASGMINAVLRKLDAEARDTWASTPPQALPIWLRKPLHKAYGVEAVAAMEAAHERATPIDITPKPGVTVEGATLLPTGSYRLAQAQVTALPGYETGDWWVQDAAAALPARLLGDVAGQRVLDLCAAPGGKTMQLAAAGADVTALDVSESRLRRVAENLSRTRLTASLVADDALTYDADPFDAILLDAPCSATGTIRRHPDLPFVKTSAEVESLTRLQMQMIDKAHTLLKPGGRMVYCTCSLLPNEGENQVKAALKRHDDLTIVPIDPVPLGGDQIWASPEGGLRLRPDFWADMGGMDGFYMALLKRG
ncbi:RsmB/NOP family class I SAM-dependent RNA methyltransferase [Nioella nitratireducens]|uniref:RsmB/NOP family class I SAM-dependent RNA methyltransferase n=1 Tax=Nioella nitratireducens TaxID=1287720 RepID=UPI0008FD27FE|nr:transcription antitermination factor NusB [Nioella nitratireducens]